jgi:hypothetical protein
MERLTSHGGCELGYDTIENSKLFLKLAPCPRDTDTHILDGSILRIIRQVSREVLPEDSHIFQDCERPFRRTIKLNGDTDTAIRTYGCTMKH